MVWLLHLVDSYVLKEKSRNMIFNHLSPTTDFSSKIQSQLTIINRNVLYLTHEMDKLKKLLLEMSHDKILQKQVDQYFEDSSQVGEEDRDFDQNSEQSAEQC